MAMISDIEDYFAKGCGRCERFATADCSTRQWAAGLAELRRICVAAGLTPPKEARTIELPEELVEALAADAEMAEAFHGLTPGRQRSYVIHLNSAKQSATRINRIAKCRDKMLAGKGFNER